MKQPISYLFMFLFVISGYTQESSLTSLCSKEQFLRQKAANTKLSTAVELLLSEKYEEAYSDLKNFQVGLDKKEGLFSLFLEAEILYKTASYSKSFELYDSILSFGNTSEDIQFYAFINAGNIKFHAQKKYDASIAYYLQAQNLVEDSNCQDKKILIYEGLGNSYLFSSQYKKSEGYYKELLGIYQQRKDQRNISRAYSNLANLFYEQYQDKKAEDYFLKALNAVENTSFIKVKQQVLYNLHMVNKGLGKHKEALDYLSQSNILKDSIWNRDKVWELAEKDKEISIAQKDKELFIQTEKTERQTRRLQWGAGILVLTLLFLGTLFYSYKTKVRQNQIITAQKGELEKLNHTKNYLFSVISHDLRSPVKMLIKQQQGFLKKIKKGETETLEETAGSALNIAESLNHLLNNVLHWSLEQNDQMIFNQQVQPISPVINQVLFDFQLLAEEKGITLGSDLDDELFINVDRESIKVVLRNLLDNAIKYTPEKGSIKITALLEGKQCQIKVADSGMGISEEQLERINSLQALSIDKINRSKGIGLGLLLCTSLTKKNGGSFQVTSQLNKGTQIQMTFPVAEEA